MTSTELNYLKATPDMSSDRAGESLNTARRRRIIPPPSYAAQFPQNVVSMNMHEFPAHSKKNI
jgi:hypothetical protein